MAIFSMRSVTARDTAAPTAGDGSARQALRTTRLLVGAVTCGWLTLLAMTVLAPQARIPFCDERAFLDNTRLLQERGMDTAFLRGMRGQAPGPLLNVVHVLAAPLTRLELPGVRVVHVLLMPVLLVLLHRLIRPVRPDDAVSLALACGRFPCSGMSRATCAAMR